MDDTLGSDMMDVALEGYAQIKLFGGAKGLNERRRELSDRWTKHRHKPAKAADG